MPRRKNSQNKCDRPYSDVSGFGKRKPFKHYSSMKVIRKSERKLNINCNKNGVSL